MLTAARLKGDEMSEQVNATDKPAGSPQKPTVISNPREVAAVVVAQMNLVNAKKDELSAALKGLTDMAQQLVVAYAGQTQLIERLASRVKALEEKTNGHGANRLAE
jgi:predicted RecB family endonuclease